MQYIFCFHLVLSQKREYSEKKVEHFKFIHILIRLCKSLEGPEFSISFVWCEIDMEEWFYLLILKHSMVAFSPRFDQILSFLAN